MPPSRPWLWCGVRPPAVDVFREMCTLGSGRVAPRHRPACIQRHAAAPTTIMNHTIHHLRTKLRPITSEPVEESVEQVDELMSLIILLLRTPGSVAVAFPPYAVTMRLSGGRKHPSHTPGSAAVHCRGAKPSNPLPCVRAPPPPSHLCTPPTCPANPHVRVPSARARLPTACTGSRLESKDGRRGHSIVHWLWCGAGCVGGANAAEGGLAGGMRAPGSAHDRLLPRLWLGCLGLRAG